MQFEYAGSQTGWVRLVNDALIPVSKWSVADVESWLLHIGIKDIATSFAAMKIDGPTFMSLTIDDLERVDIQVCVR